MSKTQQEKLAVVEEVITDLEKAKAEKRNLYYAACNGNRKIMNVLQTAASQAEKSIIENKEWDKWGCHITGREVALADIDNVLIAAIAIKSEIEKGQKVKKECASTITGDVDYDKSAIKKFGMRRTNESYRDAAERLSYSAL